MCSYCVVYIDDHNEKQLDVNVELTECIALGDTHDYK